MTLMIQRDGFLVRKITKKEFVVSEETLRALEEAREDELNKEEKEILNTAVKEEFGEGIKLPIFLKK